MINRLLATALVTASILAALVLASGESASASTTPYAQMKSVVADADAELSVRVTTTASMSGMRIVQVTDAGRSAGRQVATLYDAGKSNTFVTELIAGNLYAKGDATILVTYLALSQANANALAGQWFGIPKSSGYYAEIAQGLTVSTGMAEVSLTPSAASSPATTVDGVKVDVLKGMSVKSALEPSFQETMYFSVAKEALPVEVTQSVGGSIGTLVFSHWNEKIELTAPKVTLHLN
jgi:hypothetical protein